MDAASQRGIDDIREIRDRVVLQPVEGRYKVYILDEAHQLTDAAWNALLKLIEEPPPHLVFVFCTTDLDEGAADRALALPDVRLRAAAAARARRRCCAASPTARGSTRPTRRSRSIARSARGSFRDAVSTLDQLAAATEGEITVQAVLQLLGAVEEEALFRLCDLVVDRDTAGALTFIEELVRAGPGPRPARHRPARAPAPPAARAAPRRGARVAAGDRGDARAAARAGEPARRGDRAAALRPARRRRRRHAPGRRPAAAARARAREGDAARPRTSRASRSPTGSSCSSSARPVRRAHAPVPDTSASARRRRRASARRAGAARRRRRRSSSSSSRRRGSARSSPAVEERSIPTASMLARGAPGRARRRHAHASSSRARRSSTASSPRSRRTRRSSRDALYDVTGRKLALAFALGENDATRAEPRRRSRVGEDELVALLKETFDAKEVDE